MKLSPSATQKIFIVWFGLLTVMASMNFYHNLTDRNVQSELEKTYQQNKARYEKSIEDYETLKADVNYLKGRVACSESR